MREKWFVILFVVCYLSRTQLTAAPEIVLAEAGQARFDIVLLNDSSELLAHAANDLALHLQKISNGPFSVLDSPAAKPQIRIGTRHHPRLNTQFSHLQTRDSFSIRTETDSSGQSHIFLVGSDSTATAFAIYTFLEDLGCRWFMPGTYGEIIPQTERLVWSVNARSEKPDFRFRQIWWAYGGPKETAQEFEIWKLRNKVNFPKVQHGHNLTNTVPPEKYFATHPEYYALVNGERQTTQLCTSNPTVIRLVIDRINQFFDENPDFEAYSLCPDDNTNFCECENCRALDAGGLDKNYPGKPVVTDRYIQFLNQVARGIQPRHPGKKVATYAYVNYSTPPVREKVDPNVVVFFTSSVYCSAHGIGDLHCASRQEMKQALAGWVATGAPVYIYDYDPTPYNAELPWPLFGARQREMSDYLTLGIQGFSFESHNSWATLSPNFYIAAKTMWNSRQNLPDLLTDFTEKFFGDAHPAMTEYYLTLESMLKNATEKVEWGQSGYPRIFTSGELKKCRDALNLALKQAESTPAWDRVLIVSLGFEYLENYMKLRTAAQNQMDFETYQQMNRHCVEIIKTLYARNKDFVMRDVALDYLRRGLGQLATELFPQELGLVQDWMLIGPFDNTNYLGLDFVYPPEKEIDFSATYSGLNNQPVKWRTLHNPEWMGKIDLLPLFQETEWSTVYAVAFVESPRQRNVQIRLGSNDAIKVWLNGEEVWRHESGRIVGLDDDIFPVTLPKGKSRILLKISNFGSNWGFCFRITDENGKKISDLKYSLK